ncbi:MAG: hypothetical protein ACOYMA_22470, partial [Bacteroidia bacterium]
MKKIITLTTVLFVFLLTSYQSYAKTIDMDIYNLVQINETEIRFSVRIRNTTDFPESSGAIALAAWAFKIDFSSAFKVGGTVLTPSYVGGTGLTSGDNTPSTGNTTCNFASNYFQSYSSPANVDLPVTLLDHANWVDIGTFKMILKNGANLRNFASNAGAVLAFNTGTFTGVNECLWYDDGLGNGAASILRQTPDNYVVTVNRTVTLPNNNIPLASYFFSSVASSNWSVTTNWNKVAAASNGKNTIPVAGSSVMIGGYTTAATLTASPGTAVFDGTNISLASLTIKATSSLTLNASKQLTVTGTLTKENAAATALTLKSDATGTASLKNSTAGVTATIER